MKVFVKHDKDAAVCVTFQKDDTIGRIADIGEKALGVDLIEIPTLKTEEGKVLFRNEVASEIFRDESHVELWTSKEVWYKPVLESFDAIKIIGEHSLPFMKGESNLGEVQEFLTRYNQGTLESKGHYIFVIKENEKRIYPYGDYLIWNGKYIVGVNRVLFEDLFKEV